MKKILLALVLAGLASAPRLHAQSTVLSVALKAYSQNPTITNGSNLRFTVSKPAFTTVHLLGLVADALGTNFPPTAKLVMVNYESFQVQTADGLVLQNLEPALISARTGPYPESSTFNGSTGRDVRQYYYVLNIIFDDGGDNYFTLRGFTTENFSRSAKDLNNLRIVRDSFLMNAAGDGQLGGKDVVFTGNISGRGRRVEVN